MTKRGRKPSNTTTVAELRKRLEADPAWRAKHEAEDRARREAAARNREAAAPLLADLVSAGFYVHSVADLFNNRLDYRGVIPVLAKWLPRVSNAAVKEDIVRALSVKWTPRAVVHELIEEFKRAPAEEESLRWAIGSALEVVADEDIFEELADLARDQRYGSAREMIVLGLGKIRAPQAADVLLELLDDPTVFRHAIRGLSRRRTVESRARPRLEGFLSHPEALVRREARKALEKIRS